MARRASSELHVGWYVAAVVFAAVAILAGYLLYTMVNNPYRTLQPLNAAVYLENANSLRGNVYRVTGTIWNSLGWSPEVGRMFAIEVGETNAVDLLPVLVPAALNEVSLQKGQRFLFEVEVGDGGILRVRRLRKM